MVGFGELLDEGIFKAERANGNWTVTNISSNLLQSINFTDCTLFGLKTPITDIAVDPNDENRIWITMGRFELNSKVWHSADGGASWTNITKMGLPNLPCTAIAFQEMSNDRIYVGTDYGVYYTDNSMNCYVRYGNNGVQCMVNDMEINNCAGKLVIATHGRGLWEAPLITTPVSTPISGTVVWNSPKTIASDITIQSGTTLTILNTTITMGKNVKITVEPGARVNINGSTLTNSCNYTWKGFEIQGNSNSTQNFANQGAVIVYNGSKIEHAEIAFNALDGGILRIKDSELLNNRKTAIWDNYTLSDNTGYIFNSTLRIDADYRFIGTSNMTMLTLEDVEGIEIRGCSLTVLNNYPWDENNVRGIYAFNASFTVKEYCPPNTAPPCNGAVRSSFYGFHAAIHAKNMGSDYTFDVLSTDFDNNVWSVRSEAINNLKVRGSTFKVGKASIGNVVAHEGVCVVCVLSGTMFTIDQNVFEPTFSNLADPTTIGIRINDSGENMNEIYKNTFKKLSTNNVNVFYGNLANGVNRDADYPNIGLKYYCNSNINNTQNGYDFAVADFGVSKAIGNSGKPSKNIFSLGTSTPHSDFNNGGSLNINYWHYPSSNETPQNFENLNLFLSTSTNECPDNFISGGGGASAAAYARLETVFDSIQTQQELVKDLLENEKDSLEIIKLNSNLDGLDEESVKTVKAALAYLNNNQGTAQDKVEWYLRLDSPEGLMAAIDILIDAQNWTEAQLKINALRQQANGNADTIEKAEAFILLKEKQIEAKVNGVDFITSLDASDLAQLKSHSESMGLGGYQIRALLSHTEGGGYFVRPVFPNSTSDKRKNRIEPRKSPDLPNSDGFSVQVSPNPSANYFIFDVSTTSKGRGIEFGRF